MSAKQNLRTLLASLVAGEDETQDEDLRVGSITVLPSPSTNGGRSNPVNQPLVRKRPVSQRLSLGSERSTSMKSSNFASTKSEADEEQPVVKRKRRRKSDALLGDGLEYPGSSLFAKPTSATRPRHSAARRYSPSPEIRSTTKAKSVVNVSQSKEKPQRQKMEFNFSKLPSEYDITSVAVLECLKSDSVEFSPRKGTGIDENVTVSVEPSTDPLNGSSRPEISKKEELATMESSDEDENIPVVRMADIGAAPFTSTSISTSALSLSMKLRKKFKPPQPALKLPPRRRSSRVGSSAASDEYSSLPTVIITDQPSSILKKVGSTGSSERMSTGDGDSDNIEFSQPFVASKSWEQNEEKPLVKDKRKSTSSVSSESKRRDFISRTVDFSGQVAQGTRSSARRKSLEVGRKSLDSSLSSTQIDFASPKSSSQVDNNADQAVVNEKSSRKAVEDEAEAKPLIREEPLKGPDNQEDRNVVDSVPTETRCRSTVIEAVSSGHDKEKSLELEKTSCSSGSRAKTNPPTSVKSQGGKKANLAVNSALPSSTSRQSPALLNVRRSSRGHVLNTKLRDFEHDVKISEPWKPSKGVDPNSALSILQRVSKYTRPPRSPSPQPSASLIDTQDVKPIIFTDHPVVPPPNANFTKDSKQSDQSEETCSDCAGLFVVKKELITGDTPTKKDVGSVEPTKSSTLSQETDNQTVDETITPHTANAKSTATSSSVHVGRIFSRAVRPSSRFVNADFVLPLRKLSRSTPNVSESINQGSTGVESNVGNSSRTKSDYNEGNDSQKICDIKKVGDVSTCAVHQSTASKPSTSTGPSESPISTESSKPPTSTGPSKSSVSTESSKPPTITGPSTSAVSTEPAKLPASTGPSKPSTSTGLSKPPTVNVPVHSMETRRRSKSKKTHGVKIKLKIFNFGNFPRVRVVEDNISSKPEEKESVVAVAPAPLVKKKTSVKKFPWNRYVPSIKPVLGNIHYSDGTVEKLGVSVNAVMDRLLAEVCQDGITRHSAIINKRERRKRNNEKARERINRLKREKEALEAQGVAVPTKPKRVEQSLQLDLGPRPRIGRHTLLQKDFLYPSLKRPTKAEIKKSEELRRQRSRKVMNQLAESTRRVDEEKSSIARSAPAHLSAKHDSRAKPRDPSPPDAQKQERLRLEEEQREKQKRLTMPITFNTFLSSKTTVLTAQPLLQPQRSTNRPPIPDHFYRELLCEHSSARETVEDSWNDFDMDVDDGVDVTTIEAVHIPKLDDYVAPPVLDQSAEPVAIAVEEMLMRPSLYAEEDGISYLHERALEQPELRRNLLTMAIECISALHVARLSAFGREAAVVVYNVVTAQASKMRDVICMFSKERQEAVFWMHRYLMEMLPVELLASYLFLLRHTRLLNCQVKSIVRSTQNDLSPWPEISRIVGKYVELNVTEPDAAELERTIVQGSLSDVIFILVAPNISIGDFSVRDRHYDSVFKWLRAIGHPGSLVVRVKIDETSSTTISDVFFAAVNLISRFVIKMVKDYRQKRVVLVGWGTTCCFNHVVLNTVPGVSAIIDLAYPLLTIDGPRGEPDDDILLTYCPTLFVVGAQACDYHPGFMKLMRSHMTMPTGLVVIGHANSNLLVSCATLSRLRITQRTIARCIVEQVCDFLSMEWTKRERSRLVPAPLNDTFKIDLTQLKIDEKAAQASRKPRDDLAAAYGRKKKYSNTPTQSPTKRESSPSQLPVSQLDNIRSNFQNLLKKAGNEKSLKSPEERLLMLGHFKEPRPPTKTGSAMDSPVSTRTESPSLLDPASISLT